MYIFHYTSIDSAISIISHCSFRATNMRDLDDKQELFGGLKPLCSSMEDLQKQCRLNGLATFSWKLGNSILRMEPNYFFAISFCKKENHTFMWKNYASVDGCCIVFDKEKLLRAFNNVCYPRNSKCYSLYPVKKDFIPCKYFYEDDMLEKAAEYLNNNIEIEETLNGYQSKRNFNLSQPYIYGKPLTSLADLNNHSDIESQPTIDPFDAATRILAFALCIKQKGTEYHYEQEEEERIVFHPTFLYPFKGKSNSGKKYIEVKITPSLFLQSIKQIRLSPSCTDCTESAKKLQQEIAPIYEKYGIAMPPIKCSLLSKLKAVVFRLRCVFPIKN